MTRRLLLTATALVLALAGCSSAEPDAGTAPTAVADSAQAQQAGPDVAGALLSEHGLGGMEVEQVIDRLDRLPTADRPTDLIASVRVDQLVVSDGAQEAALDLADDRFYLSVAPYVDGTHECFYHSLTTCLGELGGQEVQVRIIDDAGEVLVDEARTTFDNGFVGFWLPRDIDGTIEVSHDGRTGAVDFSTREESPTCLTTLQLV